ncbi:phosphoribosylformylglycinamidine synthase I [Oscillochloris trichoides DG-6]|uniref:Phosphoribosylformylglycinamidine synthase subunit PurQ n=1 Tax=Oscillochloris trichoides DG-6 TaxID=765420 RepID=E1IAI7_9CHLR|nr:phosphoribosylformylglycinamidine synthase I [Oscillochloris trichoides]EFO81761.1 phosphoribosylformylglycinamidine synthase I [Oscillochloris trichoides DG-6]
MTPNVLILRAPGINRDADAALACELAGATAERVHVNRVAEGAVRLRDYAMLIIPGGFSYGDHLGAGKLLAVDLAHRLGDQIRDFVADGRPVIGICNGFQVLVKAGVLPGDAGAPSVTLTENCSARFECRWVHLQADPQSRCIFTRGIELPIEIPIAHGEGRIAVSDDAALERLRAGGQVALRYVAEDGGVVEYPANPNGSLDNIAGLCNPQGNVLGLMPHPENAVLPQQHPRWTREPWRIAGDGLALFQNAVAYAKSL